MRDDHLRRSDKLLIAIICNAGLFVACVTNLVIAETSGYGLKPSLHLIVGLMLTVCAHVWLQSSLTRARWHEQDTVTPERERL